MTNIDENCKVMDISNPYIETSIGYVEPEINVPLYGLFTIEIGMYGSKEFVCASDSKYKLKLKAYERESKYIYDETFDVNDVLSLNHIDYVIQQIKVI